MLTLSALGLGLIATGAAGLWLTRTPSKPSRDRAVAIEDEASGRAHLVDTLDRILQSYEDDVPATLQSMRTLAVSGRYGQLQEEMRRRWQDVVEFHQRRAMYVHTQAVVGFREIRRILPTLVHLEER